MITQHELADVVPEGSPRRAEIEGALRAVNVILSARYKEVFTDPEVWGQIVNNTLLALNKRCEVDPEFCNRFLSEDRFRAACLTRSASERETEYFRSTAAWAKRALRIGADETGSFEEMLAARDTSAIDVLVRASLAAPRPGSQRRPQAASDEDAERATGTHGLQDATTASSVEVAALHSAGTGEVGQAEVEQTPSGAYRFAVPARAEEDLIKAEWQEHVRARVMRAVGRLPARSRLVLQLELADMSPTEIGRHLGMKKSAVTMARTRAYEQLAEDLKDLADHYRPRAKPAPPAVTDPFTRVTNLERAKRGQSRRDKR